RLTREVRAARGATRAHTWQVCNGGATTRCDADRAVRRRERNGHSRASRPGLYWLDPLGYLDFLCLMDHARLVLTDSGGIQEETTALGVPCLTIRENTERPVTVTEGTNTLVGSDPRRLLAEAGAIVDGGGKRGRVPELWDGRAARRIANILKRAATP
ncbi:MAG: UDP-N-acetylglucosamine 2-epimerase, partial [Deltaproteobacteria bacterium]|nr:UDP-N-acetylglucosamine 2-epimerase [Deltaproteobacteria bacterium]